MKVQHISYIELNGFHERLLSLFLQAGLEQGPTLDRALGNAMTTVISEIDAARKAKAERKARLKLVED
jgi:hypothetical protein